MMLDTRYWMLDTGCRMLVVTTPSTLQPFNPSTFQPFNLSTLKPCNDLTPATLLMDLTRKMKFNIGVVLYLGI